MARSPLTEMYKRAQGMVHYVQENLSSDEYVLFLDMVDPLPEPETKPKKTTKKSSKKAAGKSLREYDHCLRCGTTKRDSSHKNESSPDYHEFESEKDIDFCARCKGATEKHPVHHERQFGGYHPFESSKQGKKPTKKSSRASSLERQIKANTARIIADDGDHGLRNAALEDITGESQERCMATDEDGPCGYPPDHNIHHLKAVVGYHKFQPAPLSTKDDNYDGETATSVTGD